MQRDKERTAQWTKRLDGTGSNSAAFKNIYMLFSKYEKINYENVYKKFHIHIS